MILAFGNKARHGKDTACEAILNYYTGLNKELAKHYGSPVGSTRVKRVNFADALKQEVNKGIEQTGSIENLLAEMRKSNLFQVPDWVQPEPIPGMDDPQCPLGKHPKVLQWWGTEYRRAENQNYWIDKWKEQVSNFKGIVVCGDLRFWNEAEGVKELGGYTVNVERLNPEGTRFFATDRQKDHISETQLDGFNFDFYIKVATGHVALVEQQAITLAEYLLALERK